MPISARWCTTLPGGGAVSRFPRRSSRVVNEIIAKRMNKKQQMRWNRTTAQSVLDVRTAVLNDKLEDAFRHRYLGLRPTNDDQVLSKARMSPRILHALPSQEQ
jgi:hypothetical protein